MSRMDVPHRIGQTLLAVLTLITIEELEVLVHITRDHIEVEPLRRLRLPIHEQRQRLWARIAQPFLDGEAIALRLRDLLALLVEEELVVETLGWLRAERARHLTRELPRSDQDRAVHRVVDAERDPAHRPGRLPLQLGRPAGNRRLEALASLGIAP